MFTAIGAQAQPCAELSPTCIQDSLSTGFDPERFPILARHWPDPSEYVAPANINDVLGPKHIGPIAAEIVAGIRFRHHVEHLHCLGPRAVGELLAELGAERAVRTVIDDKLKRYAELDPKVVAATGGDGFWQVPLSEVQS